MTARKRRGLDSVGGSATDYRYVVTCKNNPRGC